MTDDKMYGMLIKRLRDTTGYYNLTVDSCDLDQLISAMHGDVVTVNGFDIEITPKVRVIATRMKRVV